MVGDPRIVPIRREIAGFLDGRVAAGNLGFADPRTVRMLPLWQQIFAELKLQPKFVLCLRNPAAAARSAHQCDGVDPDIAEYRWFVHMADFFRYAGKAEHCALEYEAWCNDPAANLDKLQDFLGLEWLHGATERDLALASIAALAASPEEAHNPEPRQPMVRSFYRLARGSDDKPGAAGPREQIVQQFVAFQQLQKPLEKSLAAHAAAATEIARRRDSLAADCAALGAELATARLTLAEQDAALAQGRAQLEGAGRLVTEREAAQQALQARFDEAASLLAAVRSEGQELQAAAAATRQELAAARLAGDERAAALDASLLSLRSEIAERDRTAEALEAALQASRRERDRASTALQTEVAAAEQARRSEVEELRSALRRGEQEIVRRAADRQAAEAEAAALRDALSAARQVGKAAMQALALAAIPMPPVERAGWLSTIRRRLWLPAR